MLKKSFAVIIAAFALSACAFDQGVDDVAPPETLENRLGHRVTLDLEPTSLVGVAAYDKDGNSLPCVQPTVTGGTAVLRSTETGLLLVEDLEVSLSDVQIEEGVILPSDPVNLTDLRLQLGTQIALEPDWYADPSSVSGFATADLLMDWAVRADDGDIHPLATQRLRDAEFEVVVTLDEDGSIKAQVTTAVEGTIGNFANRIELSDFSLAVKAKTPAVDIQ